MLESDEYGSSAELARAEKVNASYLGRILRLTIGPDIIERSLPANNPAHFNSMICSSHCRQHGLSSIPSCFVRSSCRALDAFLLL
jgi:hypothetical protein